MDAILRATVMYFFLFLVFRIAGKRSIAHITTFDFVLLLMIGEATQQALIGDDYSLTNAFILVTTLVIIEAGLSLLKRSSPVADKILDDVPVIVLSNGKFLKERMNLARVDEREILSAARTRQGLESADQIKYAIVEQSGEISIIPR
jgi:uncharacterized membrane protein YcaP (DUF421 family)